MMNKVIVLIQDHDGLLERKRKKIRDYEISKSKLVVIFGPRCFSKQAIEKKNINRQLKEVSSPWLVPAILVPEFKHFNINKLNDSQNRIKVNFSLIYMINFHFSILYTLTEKPCDYICY